jgi:hypothetical protein
MNPARLFEGLYRNLFDNPILTRELRRRMRGKALVVSMIGYIVLMTATSILVLLARVGSASIIGGNETQEMLRILSSTGNALFWWISLIQGLLVLIIAPTITAGMTTGEKERQTFDFLRVTTISPWMYITGCFLSTVFYVTMALLCALPLISLAFLYGGVGRGEVIRMFAFLLATSMVLSAFGLYISSVRERTRTAQGIVVFVIFAILFGGSIGASALMSWLGGGTMAGSVTFSATWDDSGGDLTTTTAPATAAAPVSADLVFTFTLLALMSLAIIFLLMATRKLFEPDDTRALSHLQFGILFVVVSWLIFPMLALVPGSNLTTLVFLFLMAVLLAAAACVFAVGRMEVGDEIWHLKRLFPFLRPFDQTIPFLILIALLAWIFLGQFFDAMAGKTIAMLAPFGGMESAVTEAPAAGLAVSYPLVLLSSFFFLCFLARFATAIAIARKGAGRITFTVIGILWIGVPVLCGLFHAATPLGGVPVTADLLQTIPLISPFSVVIDAIKNPLLYPATSSVWEARGAWAAIVYLAAGIAIGAYGEVLRWRRWRGFDYHYDMELA